LIDTVDCYDNAFSSDLAREKNAKTQKGKSLASSEMDGNKGLSLQERQLRDAAK
jgi:hypothetical protein